MKKDRKPGRVTLKCVRCTKEFSTHSTNRDHCHECKPKCGEVHYFNEGANAVKKRVVIQKHEQEEPKLQVPRATP